MKLELRLILLFTILFNSFCPLSAQEETINDPLVIELDKVISDDKRDEVQRYFGYEDLLFRYLTLPYDLSSNMNQQGRYVDLGFALFMLLPLVFLGVVYRHRKLFYTSLIPLFLFLSLCLSYSFNYTQSHGQVNNHGANWESYTAHPDKSIIESITTGIFNISYYASIPFRTLGKQISGDKDHYTYPILIFLYLASLWLIVYRLKLSNKGQFVAAIFIPFSFLWLSLSSGIIWYGFLFIPLSLVGILHFCDNDKFKTFAAFPFIKNISLLFLLIWASMCWVGRISNINTVPREGNTDGVGKGILEAETFRYSTAIINANEARSRAYGNINGALDNINSNDAYIYQVGTFFAFDIKNNSQRLFQDNTLSQFFWLVNTLKEKEKIIASLKASSFKYILIDLYTHTLDKTPEKSLTKKYQLLLHTVHQNPSVRLLATDRVIEFPQSDGTRARVSEVFGENIIKFGSYAIYEIL